MDNNFPYGQCHVCGGAIAIPGLDYFLCGGKCDRYVMSPDYKKVVSIEKWKSQKN